MTEPGIEPLRLLIVCLGNICRSPMAEGLVRARIQASKLAGRVVVDSAGTGAWHVGQPPDPRAIATAARHGVDIGGLRGRQLDAGDGDRFDWLLCADRANLREVRALLRPSEHPRTALLLDWAGVAAEGEVPDPYDGNAGDFERTWELLDHAALGVVARLQHGGAAGRQS
jgi:protein-tyrosine phosphatase